MDPTKIGVHPRASAVPAGFSLFRPQLDVVEFDPIIPMALESNYARGMFAVSDIEESLTVQDNHEVVALCCDLVLVPLIGVDLYRTAFAVPTRLPVLKPAGW